MFFKDDNEISVCQLGTGDVMVSETELKGISPKKIVGIVFGEIKEGEIGRSLPELEGKLDFEANVKFKLLFTKTESIDVVIEELKQAKKLMESARHKS